MQCDCTGSVGLGGWGAAAAALETSELQMIKVPLQHFWGKMLFFLRVSPNQDDKTKWSSYAGR